MLERQSKLIAASILPAHAVSPRDEVRLEIKRLQDAYRKISPNSRFEKIGSRKTGVPSSRSFLFHYRFRGNATGGQALQKAVEASSLRNRMVPGSWLTAQSNSHSS